MSDEKLHIISDHEIECPECHQVIDFRRESAEAHCIVHWGIPYRSITTMRNASAHERYSEIMRAFDAFTSGRLNADSADSTTVDNGRIKVKEA